MEVFQSQDIKFSRGSFFFLVCHHRLFFTGQHVVYVDCPIRMHHDLFDQQLDHRLAVLKAEPLEIPPQEGTKVANMVRDVVPLNCGIALLFYVVSFLLASLEALDDLLAAGRQVLQGNDLLLIGINETLSLPLEMAALHIDTLQLVVALPLLALLDVLPQGVCLQNALWLLEQFPDQSPHQGIETIRTHPTGGTRLHTSHGHRVLSGTAIIQGLIAFADAQLPRRLHGQLALTTADQRPQEIPLRRGLIGAAGFDSVLLELCLGFGTGLRADEGWCGNGDPLLGRTRLAGIIVRARVKFPPCLLARDARSGAIIGSLARIDGVAEHTAYTGHMPYRVLTRLRGNLQRVQALDNLPRGQLFVDQPVKHVPHHHGLVGVDLNPGQQPGLFGNIAVPVGTIGPGQKLPLLGFVQPAAACPVGNLCAFVCGDHPLHLG